VADTVWKRLRSVREPDAKSSIWSLPIDDEHILNTGSPEDLFLNPEDFDVNVERVQEHETVWTRESTTDANWYTFDSPTSEFYVVDVWDEEI